MTTNLIAHVLHRETIEALVGARTFERGDRCFRAKRVMKVVVDSGQLRGTVRPSESGRADYAVHVWTKEDGIAYRCTCPVGAEGRFCKHAVAIALAHLEQTEHEATAILDRVAMKLASMPHDVFLMRLAERARTDEHLRTVLIELAQ